MTYLKTFAPSAGIIGLWAWKYGVVGGKLVMIFYIELLETLKYFNNLRLVFTRSGSFCFIEGRVHRQILGLCSVVGKREWVRDGSVVSCVRVSFDAYCKSAVKYTAFLLVFLHVFPRKCCLFLSDTFKISNIHFHDCFCLFVWLKLVLFN